MLRANFIVQAESAELFPTVLGDPGRLVVIVIVFIVIVIIVIAIVVVAIVIVAIVIVAIVIVAIDIVIIIFVIVIVIVIVAILIMTTADFREDGSSVTLRSSRLFEDLKNSNASLPTTTV